MITSIGNALNSDHVLDIFDTSSGDDRNINVIEIRQALKDIFRFWRKGCKVGMWSNWGECAVVVQKKCKFVRVSDVAEIK